MTVALEQVASEQTARAGVTEMVAHLLDLLGRPATAAMLGVPDPATLIRAPRSGQELPADVEQRLRTAFYISKLLGQVESAQAVRAWFLGMNPYLDDQAPARLIGTEPARVMQAARRFLAEG